MKYPSSTSIRPRSSRENFIPDIDLTSLSLRIIATDYLSPRSPVDHPFFTPAQRPAADARGRSAASAREVLLQRLDPTLIHGTSESLRESRFVLRVRVGGEEPLERLSPVGQDETADGADLGAGHPRNGVATRPRPVIRRLCWSAGAWPPGVRRRGRTRVPRPGRRAPL